MKYNSLARRIDQLDLKMKVKNINTLTCPKITLMVDDEVMLQGDPFDDDRWSIPKMQGLPQIVQMTFVKTEFSEPVIDSKPLSHVTPDDDMANSQELEPEAEDVILEAIPEDMVLVAQQEREIAIARAKSGRRRR